MPRQNREVTSALIQDTAIELLAAKGYKEITMVEIAQKANVAKRTLYKYYPSKIELFASVFEQYQGMLISAEKAADFRDLSYGETIRKILEVLYDFTSKNESFMRLFWMLNTESAENGEAPAELREQIRKWSTRIVAEVSNLLRGKEASGIFAQYSPELIVHMLSALNKGIYLQIEKESSIGMDQPKIDDLLQLLYEMLSYCSRFN